MMHPNGEKMNKQRKNRFNQRGVYGASRCIGCVESLFGLDEEVWKQRSLFVS
jgi:hypothetical protein